MKCTQKLNLGNKKLSKLNHEFGHLIYVSASDKSEDAITFGKALSKIARQLEELRSSEIKNEIILGNEPLV